MEEKLYSSFVDATRNVFNSMLNISEISVRAAEHFNCDDEVDIAIGIAGDLQGEVIYRFPAPTSLNMVQIMSGMQFERIDAFVTSAMAELANIISGNVFTSLSNNDIKCNILPPVECNLDEKNGYKVKTSCCICTTIGQIGLEIRLK